MKNLPDQIISASRRDGFHNTSDRNLQSIKDNLKQPCTLIELCQKTELPREEVYAYLRQLAREGILSRKGLKLRCVE